MGPVIEVLNNCYGIDDAKAVDAHFTGLISRWADRLEPYVEAADRDSTFVCMPLLVNKAFRFLGNEPGVSIAMADIFKAVYFSNTINLSLGDEAEGQSYDRQMQFGILIADYLFGRVLKALMDLDAAWLLGDFANMMAEINEGFVLQHCLDADAGTVIEKTRIPLYTTAFYAAGRLAGCDGESARAYSRIGGSLGMAMELYSIGDPKCRQHLLEANAMLQSLNIRNRNFEHDLCRLVDVLAGEFVPDSQIAAV